MEVVKELVKRKNSEDLHKVFQSFLDVSTTVAFCSSNHPFMCKLHLIGTVYPCSRKILHTSS